VKASPTVFGSIPHVQRTGRRRGNEPRLKTITLKNMKDKNWTILRNVLNLSSFCLISLFNLQPLSNC